MTLHSKRTLFFKSLLVFLFLPRVLACAARNSQQQYPHFKWVDIKSNDAQGSSDSGQCSLCSTAFPLQVRLILILILPFCHIVMPSFLQKKKIQKTPCKAVIRIQLGFAGAAAARGVALCVCLCQQLKKPKPGNPHTHLPDNFLPQNPYTD